MRKPLKWSQGLALIGNTVVGTVEEVRHDEWQAYGCLEDWQDIDLGAWRSESKARTVVRDWVKALAQAGEDA